MQIPRSVRKEARRHSGTAVSLQPHVRWQTEPLQSSELTGGEKFHMQVPYPHCSKEFILKKIEGVLCWGCLLMGGPSLQETLMLVEVHGWLSTVGGTPCCHIVRLWGAFPLRAREQQKQDWADWDWLQPSSSALPCATWWERGSKTGAGKQKRVGGNVYLRFCCFFSLSYYNFIGELLIVWVFTLNWF